MNKSTILLLSSPTILSSMLLLLLSDKPAEARENEQHPILSKTQAASQGDLNCDRANCTGNNHLVSFERIFTAPDQQLEPEMFPNLERTPEGHLILEFTEEESETAIKLFGCDCVKSINALRQMRGIAIGVEGNRILPGPPIQTCSENRLE
ncbi:MAG: hypothetical protein AB4372_01040 [Xenococcus sp. (in: cyanobacteria)]